MRVCEALFPSRSSAVHDPSLHGVGRVLEEIYAPLLAEALPEAWLRLLGGAGPPREGARSEGPAAPAAPGPDRTRA